MSLNFLSRPGAGRFTVQLVNNDRSRFAVFDPDDRQVSDVFPSRGAANVERDRLQRAKDAQSKRGKRACLCCGTSFDSEGIHHRMCNGCRLRGDALGMPVAFGFGAATGRRKG